MVLLKMGRHRIVFRLFPYPLALYCVSSGCKPEEEYHLIVTVESDGGSLIFHVTDTESVPSAIRAASFDIRDESERWDWRSVWHIEPGPEQSQNAKRRVTSNIINVEYPSMFIYGELPDGWVEDMPAEPLRANHTYEASFYAGEELGEAYVRFELEETGQVKWTQIDVWSHLSP